MIPIDALEFCEDHIDVLGLHQRNFIEHMRRLSDCNMGVTNVEANSITYLAERIGMYLIYRACERLNH